MAKKRSKVATKKVATREDAEKRKRRTDEELITDLQEKIRQVKARQAAKDMQKSPTMKGAVSALRAIDRALETAASHGETALRHVLSDSRKPLVEFLESSGFRTPKANIPRGRRPKTD
jgi:hypothetical protein